MIKTNTIESNIDSSQIYSALQSSCILILTDKCGVIIQANENFCNLSGYNQEEIIGKKYNFSMVDKRSSTDFFLFWQSISVGTVSEFEMNNRAKDGNLFWTKNTLIPIIDDKTRQKKGFLSIIIDITRRKKSEQEAEKLREQLLQSQKMETIGQLASGVAHDFNNILMPIIGFTRMGLSSIEKNELTRAADYLKRVEKSANRAVGLVDEILVFSREKSTKAEYPIQPAEVIQEVIGISPLLRSGIGTSIQLLFDDSTDENFPSILIDASELHQIITNLIINARDAIAEQSEFLKKIKISLFLSNQPKKIYCNACGTELDGTYVVISVSDTGSGIDPEKIARIFEPFFTTKELGKGSGLGLSVVSGILHNLDAHITVESEINKGTTFSLFFPPVCKVNFEKEIYYQVPLSSTLKVCVVDDEEDITFLLKNELSSLGYEVQTFRDGLEAFNVINERIDYFDVIITDYGMPVMNGLDLADKVLEKRPQMPILICTGYSSKLKKADDLPKGNVFLFKKPVDVNVLNMTIQKLFIGK